MSDMTRPSLFSLILTGGIGSGKTTVARLFADRGASVIDTDEIAHRLTAPGGDAIPLIRDVFGAAFIAEDGSLDRGRMRELVFQDESARKRLENILHPMIHEDALRQAALAKGSYVIYVIPLLVEQPVWQDLAHRVLLVDCPEELQLERVMARNGMAREQVASIMATQASRKERMAIADDVIVNDNGIGPLTGQVAELDAAYRKIAQKMRP